MENEIPLTVRHMQAVVVVPDRSMNSRLNSSGILRWGATRCMLLYIVHMIFSRKKFEKNVPGRQKRIGIKRKPINKRLHTYLLKINFFKEVQTTNLST